MVVVPHPPYSSHLVPCDFASFPKLKVKQKGRRFETVSDIQKESQAVLESIKENDFHVVFEALKKYEIGVYIPKKTILKEMTSKIKLSQHLFFDLLRELSDTPRSVYSFVTQWLRDRRINNDRL
jgi:hypothetical protein